MPAAVIFAHIFLQITRRTRVHAAIYDHLTCAAGCPDSPDNGGLGWHGGGVGFSAGFIVLAQHGYRDRSVFWYELNFHHSLLHFGVYPREVFGLKGILFSPFLHGDIEHLANNSIALLVLLPILRYFYKEQSFVVLFLGILFSGLGTWLLGRPSYHIGASGLIYALVSFIFFKGIFTKYYRLVALSFTIVILYG